jgi:hypothetical protein
MPRNFGRISIIEKWSQPGTSQRRRAPATCRRNDALEPQVQNRKTESSTDRACVQGVAALQGDGRSAPVLCLKLMTSGKLLLLPISEIF